MNRNLANAPLIEAFVEVRWALEETGPRTARDHAYPLFVAGLYADLKDSYPYIENLPAKEVPDEVTPHVVKFRFRKAENAWPLIQAGPGVASMNFGADYTWDRFLASAQDFFPKLLTAYEMGGVNRPPEFTRMLLRFMNGINLDYTKEDVLAFTREKLHTDIQLPAAMTAGGQTAGLPGSMNLQLDYPFDERIGRGGLQIATGKQEGENAVIVQLSVRNDEEVPQSADAFSKWLTEAHDLIENWFFALIEGDLEKSFAGG